jgi:hypothetical protein
MAVTGRNHRNPRAEIEEDVPVHIFDEHALASTYNQRILASIGGGDEPVVEGEDLLSLGAGQRRLDLR